MVAYKILEIGDFMKLFLADSEFDSFFVSSIAIRTNTDYMADGRRNKDWCEEESEYLYWKELKGFVYDRIKGTKKPSLLKVEMFVDKEKFLQFFHLTQEEREKLLLCRIKSFRLNFKYEIPAGQTGTSEDFSHGMAAGQTGTSEDFSHGMAAGQTGASEHFDHNMASGQKEKLSVTTGVSYEEFSMDRTWEQCWDENAALFLKGLSLTLEKM